MANITEDGIISIHNLSNQQEEPILADVGSCRTQMIYSSTLDRIILITENGYLKSVNSYGEVMATAPLKIQKADNYNITLQDINGNGYEEILVSGGGDAIYAYDRNLNEVVGFPISGKAAPYFIDINGDGRKDIISCSIDNKIHVFAGGY